ncbi:MAG: hypothetical protein R3F43_22335 [bacterium]
MTIATAVMVAGSLIYGGVRMSQFDARVEAAEKLKIGLVEGDVGIFLTETREKRDNHLLINQQLSAQAEAEGAELIVWSESAFRARQLLRSATRFLPSELPLVRRRLGSGQQHPHRGSPDAHRGFHTPLMFGSTLRQPDTEPRWKGDKNYLPRNAWLLDADGNVVGACDKVFLLAFREYVPFAKYIPWIYDVIKAAGSLEPGTKLNLIEADLWGKGPIKFGMLICYEGILPEFTLKIGQHPHLLVNLTNDDWFGKTAEALPPR